MQAVWHWWRKAPHLASDVGVRYERLLIGSQPGDQGGELLVHALYARDAAPGAFDEMDRRVRIAVDGKKKK